jgi:hypothetical protein
MMREDTRRGAIPQNKGLVKLADLPDFEVAEGQPDVHGWEVVGRQAQVLGRVADLIVDPEIMKVRYLSVALSDWEARHDAKPYRLIPIGLASLDREDKVVLLRNVDADVVRGYPAYNGGHIEHDFEVMLRKAYLGGMDPGIEAGRDSFYQREGFYEHDDFDEDRFYNPRRPGPTRFHGK